MNPTIQSTLSLSIIFAVVIGIVRFRKIDTSYYPFIYNIVIVLLVEVINATHAYSISTIKTLNVFSLIEFCLFALLFHNWGLFNRNKKWFLFIISIYTFAWIIITFFLTGFENINNPFLIIYSFTLIFFSVSTFNKTIVQQRIDILKNAKFWICLGIIIFYSFFILTRATDMSVGLEVSKSFKQNLQLINDYSNLLVNLLYAVAIIWMPRKKNITTLL
jgi:hypothetical protein